MKNAIVTGAGGFIGKRLVAALLARGVNVYALVRDQANLAEFNSDNLFIYEISLSDYKDIPLSITQRNFDVCYHLAWQGTFGESFKDYKIQMNNAVFSVDLLRSIKQIDCKKFVFAGSIVEIEVKKYFTTDCLKPRMSCVYGTAKLAAEMLCKTFAYSEGIEFNCAILSSIFGVGDYSKRIHNSLIHALHKGIAPKLIEGNLLYDWLYVDDAVNGLIAIGDKGINFKNYYIGHRQLKTFREIVIQVKDILNPNVELRFGEFPDEMPLDYSLIDLDALYEDTGFEAKCDFTKSIIETSQWLKSLKWKD